jgi:hypothetical protein
VNLLAAPTVSYCEKAGLGLIKRPWFLVSNLAFFVSGYLILQKGHSDATSRLFGLAIIMVGVLSSVYDITFTRWSQLLDLSGMVILASVILFINLTKIFSGQARLVWTFLVLLFGASFASMVTLGAYSGNVIFGLYVILICFTEFWLYRAGRHKEYKNWLIGLTLLTVGFGFWLTDVTQIICFKIGLFNGRSIFHYLTATAIYFVYLFYASQDAQPELK